MTTVDDYVAALERELRDQPRTIRRREAAGLREHLDELPPDALERLDEPTAYAQEYRAQRDLRPRRFGAWRRVAWPGRLLVLALVVVVIAAVAVPTSIAHYQPLTGHVYFGGPDTVTSHDEHDGTVFAFREGGLIRIGMDFKNSGPFDATVTGLADEGETGILQLAGVGIVTPPACCSTDVARPARFPIRVPAHSVRTVTLTFRLTTCKHGSAGRGGGGYSAGVSQLFFAAKALGVNHRIVVHFNQFWIDVPDPLPPCGSAVVSP